ncbi:MAG: type II toxin-antitoxin system VapC family toxin [Actinobacteria bacterium]|nr:type II toxin-antitoxin system VapC family toxin [Actinomycetota bacterium]MBM3712139.1 type II toxin-antitoxin system VapC family toxin [Actinomycetota bacterium]
MNLVDSSGWLEYFTGGKNADRFVNIIEDTERLIVSTINIYEIYKKVISQKDEDAALEAVAMMQYAKVIEVTSSIAIQAAKFSYIFKVPLADSIIFITARENDAVIWTQDFHFKDMDGVQYFEQPGNQVI